MVDGNNKHFQAQMVRCNYLFNWARDNPGGYEIVRSFAGNPQGSAWLDDEPRGINHTWMATQETLFVFGGGINDNAGRAAIFDGWTNGREVARSQGFNTWAFDWCNRWWLPSIPFQDFRNKQVCFVGQSAGGIACLTAQYLAFGSAPRPQDVYILTGTPRTLAFEFPGFYPTGNITRFMLVGDPIVNMPPRFPEWPEVCLCFSAYVAPFDAAEILFGLQQTTIDPVFGLWPLFHHPPGGIVLNDSGYGWAANSLPPPRSSIPISLTQLETANRLFGVPQHEMMAYVNAVQTWAILNTALEKPLEPEAPSVVGGSDWGPEIGLICPDDLGGNITFSPNGRIDPMSNIVQTGTMPGPNDTVAGALYLRGQLVAIFPTRGKAKTAATRLNRFLSRLPYATEVSTTGLSDGMLQYLAEAAIGGGVDRRPVRVVT